MSAGISRAAVLSCLRDAAARLVADMSTATAAAELGIDPSSVRRKRAGTKAWLDEELAGLIAYETQETGESSIGAALNLSFVGGPAGDPAAATTDVFAELRRAGELVADISAKLKDGKLSPREARDLAEKIRAHQKAERQVLRDLDALGAAHSGGRSC